MLDNHEMAEILIFLSGGAFREKLEAAFIIFDMDQSKTLSFSELVWCAHFIQQTDFIGTIFRVFFSIVERHSDGLKKLDPR